VISDDLIERLKRKEEDALREVMTMYKNRILNFLHLMVGNRQMAEELTQDTFVRVYFKAGTLKTRNLRAWIYKIATNLARTHLRKNRLKQILSLSDTGEEEFLFDPEHEKKALMEDILAKLPRDYRIALIMKDIDNFSLEEMSQILNKSVSSLKANIFRGRKLLKNMQLSERRGHNE
jgi:RNA polymerase sigma-70 factor, ECF subfamily